MDPYIQMQTLLLDLDGTISDPVIGIGRSINFALQTMGYPPRDDQELPRYVGPPLDESFVAITGEADADAIDRFVLLYRQRYSEVGYSENVIYPGIPEALSTLHANSVELGLCTYKRVDYAEMILDLFDIRRYFSFINGGRIGQKKWEQIATLKKEGLVTSSTIMVGDRAADIIGARRNGIRSAAVLWGYGDREELMNEEPDYLLTNPEELVGLGTGESSQGARGR